MWDIFENVDQRHEAFAPESAHQLGLQNSFFPIFLE